MAPEAPGFLIASKAATLGPAADGILFPEAMSFAALAADLPVTALGLAGAGAALGLAGAGAALGLGLKASLGTSTLFPFPAEGSALAFGLASALAFGLAFGLASASGLEKTDLILSVALTALFFTAVTAFPTPLPMRWPRLGLGSAFGSLDALARLSLICPLERVSIFGRASVTLGLRIASPAISPAPAAALPLAGS
jgi:hypothetical protein